MTSYGLLMCVPMLALLAWAVVTDWSARRIPNWLTFTLLLSGLVQSATTSATVGFRGAFLGFLVGFTLTFLLFALGGLSGGDVKLLAGLGAWLGPMATVQVFLAEAVVGAVMALVQAAAQGQLRTVVRNSAVLAGSLVAGTADPTIVAGSGAPDSDAAAFKRMLPYSLPVFVATVIVLVTRWGGHGG